MSLKLMIHKCTLPSTIETATTMCKEEMIRGRRGDGRGERKNRKVEGEMLPAE